MPTSFSCINTVTGTAFGIDRTLGLNPVFSISADPILPGTGSTQLPTGTTAQRLLRLGAIRLNTTTGFIECSVDGIAWVDLAVGGGGIASVTGTANRITVTAGPNPIVDIAATYIGQASITTLGTITTGIWNAGNVTTPLLTVDNIQIDVNTISSLNVGGDILLLCNTTGAVEISSNATKAGTLRFREPVGGGTNFITFQAPAMAGDTSYQWWPAYPTANGQLSTCTTAGVMTWTTATFPTVAGAAGTILRSDGTNWIASTSTFADTYGASTLLYSNGANTVTGLATANNGVLVTSNAGVPSILGGPGTTGNILQSNAAAAPSFSTATYPSSTTINRILFSTAANVVGELATANSASLVTTAAGVPVFSATMTNGQVIIGSTGGTPAAATLTAGAGIAITPGANSITIAATGGASGSLVLLATQTAAASATLDFTTNLDATYAVYFFTISALIPATNATSLWIRISTDGGGTWKSGASDYSYVCQLPGYSATGNSSAGAAQLIANGTAGATGFSNAAGATANGTCYLFNPASATFPVFMTTLSFKESASSFGVYSTGGGFYTTAAAINGVRFMMSSGNITSGVIRLYGIKNA